MRSVILAAEMAQGTAKDALGEASEQLGHFFALIDAVSHVAELASDQRALLRAFGKILDAVLTSNGNPAVCYASGEIFAVRVAQLTGSDVIVGGSAMLHLGKQYCDVFLESAHDRELRNIMQKVARAAKRV